MAYTWDGSKVADFMDAVVERDPRSKAGVERTDGFLTHNELLERVREIQTHPATVTQTVADERT